MATIYEQPRDSSFLYTSGLETAKASNTTLIVQPGICRDSTNAIDMQLSTGTIVNGAENGLNGLDTGSLQANKLYNLFMIGDVSQTNPTGLILSLNSIPQFPVGTQSGGWNIYRQIGVWSTDNSSQFYLMYQYGPNNLRYYEFDAPVSVLTGGNVTTPLTKVDISNLVPLSTNADGIESGTPVELIAAFTPNAASDAAFIVPGSTSDVTISQVIGQVSAVVQNFPVMVTSLPVSGKPAVYYKVSSGSDALTLYVKGFWFAI